MSHPPLHQTHGHSKGFKHTKAYSTWHNVKQRCLNPKAPSYAKYGAKGIAVCERWLIFENFLADMGEPPTLKHSIDRYPDKNGNYEPGNCRWATPKEQSNNKNLNIILVHAGRSQTLTEWATELGLKPNTLCFRLRRRWDLARALTKDITSHADCNNRMLTYEGKTMSVAAWARHLGVNKRILYVRLHRGWTLEKTLTEPVRAC